MPHIFPASSSPGAGCLFLPICPALKASQLFSPFSFISSLISTCCVFHQLLYVILIIWSVMDFLCSFPQVAVPFQQLYITSLQPAIFLVHAYLCLLALIQAGGLTARWVLEAVCAGLRRTAGEGPRGHLWSGRERRSNISFLPSTSLLSIPAFCPSSLSSFCFLLFILNKS